MQNPLYRAFIEAGREAGYPVTTDYNGHQQEGFAVLDIAGGGEVDGLLGMNVLSRFRFEIDQDEALLRLQVR